VYHIVETPHVHQHFRFASLEKIFEVDAHVGAAMSGMSADAQTLIEHA
jgi:20S proteasome alpha/beta subunit